MMSDRLKGKIITIGIIISAVIVVMFWSWIWYSHNRGHLHGEMLTYKGTEYVEVSGNYKKDKIIGITDDGWWLYSVKGNSGYLYIMASNYWDDELFVREDYYSNHTKQVLTTEYKE